MCVAVRIFFFLLADIEGVTAESLNDHYAAISTDHSYISSHRNYPANFVESEYISE